MRLFLLNCAWILITFFYGKQSILHLNYFYDPCSETLVEIASKRSFVLRQFVFFLYRI